MVYIHVRKLFAKFGDQKIYEEIFVVGGDETICTWTVEH
jgi:hypothetical protein